MPTAKKKTTKKATTKKAAKPAEAPKVEAPKELSLREKLANLHSHPPTPPVRKK